MAVVRAGGPVLRGGAGRADRASRRGRATRAPAFPGLEAPLSCPYLQPQARPRLLRDSLMLPHLRVLTILLFCAGVSLAADWPAWRGPTGDGRSPEKDAPLTWSRTENVRWKAPLPSPGNSTPV